MLVVLTEKHCNKVNIQITQRDDFIQIARILLFMLPGQTWVFRMTWSSIPGFALSSEQLYLPLFEQKESRNERELYDLPIRAAEYASWSSVLIGCLTLTI